MQVPRQPASVPAVAVAILYVISGAVGILPGLFVLLVLAIGIPFWYFVLRVAATPVTFEMFTAGMQTSLLETWPDFPFGVLGLAVLALHFVAAIPAAPRGIAVLRGAPTAERALQRLGWIYLFIFPVGTVLGLAALATLGRATKPASQSQEPLASPGDRTTAAFCYAVPVLAAIYVFMRGNTSAFVRMHAIQSSAVGIGFYVIARIAEFLHPPAAAPVVLGAILALAVFAFVAYSGRRFRLPVIGGFAERTQEGFERGQAQWKAHGELRMHQRRLAAASPAGAHSITTPIEGTRAGEGFEQRQTAKAESVALLVVAGVFALFLLMLLAGAWKQLTHGDLSRGGPIAVIAGTLFFGAVLVFFIYLLANKALSGSVAEGRLLVREWPLKPGASVRMQYRAKTRFGGKIESVDVELKCLETIAWVDGENSSRTRGLCVREVVVPPVRPMKSADGSVSAEWTLHVPADGPPSFAGKGGSIAWIVMVGMRITGAPDSSHTFPLMVAPEMAS